MSIALLIQAPAKFYEAVPYFYREADKFGFIDKYYVATDFKGPYDVGDNCSIHYLKKDKQFSANMLDMLSMVDEDIFFVCCEDHVFMPKNDLNVWQKCFSFIEDNESVGFLRLTNNNRIKLTTKDFIAPVSRKDKYYISLQPAIWRKEYFKHALKKGEDAWKFEINGAGRAKKFKGMSSYCVQETIFHHTNFYKSGKYYRHKFADYAIRNGFTLDSGRKIIWKGNLYTFGEYVKVRK
tara:strand:- start:212 stop:922 length:711 start_codon:yes stop_codon:yes gene_type:complete